MAQTVLQNKWSVRLAFLREIKHILFMGLALLIIIALGVLDFSFLSRIPNPLETSLAYVFYGAGISALFTGYVTWRFSNYIYQPDQELLAMFNAGDKTPTGEKSVRETQIAFIGSNKLDEADVKGDGLDTERGRTGIRVIKGLHYDKESNTIYNHFTEEMTDRELKTFKRGIDAQRLINSRFSMMGRELDHNVMNLINNIEEAVIKQKNKTYDELMGFNINDKINEVEQMALKREGYEDYNSIEDVKDAVKSSEEFIADENKGGGDNGQSQSRKE